LTSSSNRQQYHSIRGRWNGPFHMLPFAREDTLPSLVEGAPEPKRHDVVEQRVAVEAGVVVHQTIVTPR